MHELNLKKKRLSGSSLMERGESWCCLSDEMVDKKTEVCHCL